MEFSLRSHSERGTRTSFSRLQQQHEMLELVSLSAGGQRKNRWHHLHWCQQVQRSSGGSTRSCFTASVCAAGSGRLCCGQITSLMEPASGRFETTDIFQEPSAAMFVFPCDRWPPRRSVRRQVTGSWWWSAEQINSEMTFVVLWREDSGERMRHFICCEYKLSY